MLEQRKKEELGWKSPFEIYNGGKSNELLNDGKSSIGFNIDIVRTKLPSQNEYLHQIKQTEDWINAAKKAIKRMAKLMVEKHACKNICKTYNPSEKVFVRIEEKRGKFTQRHKVLARAVEKRYRNDIYLVKYKLPNSDDSTKPKFRVEDVCNFPKDKNVNAKENEKNKERKAYKKSLRIPKSRNDLIGEITDQGHIVTYDPPGDGNCQFSAL